MPNIVAPYARSQKSANYSKARTAASSTETSTDDEAQSLPTKPSSSAPRNAKIISRVINPDSVLYQLSIGDIEIKDVAIDEVLDYVSAFDLEAYENQQFKIEAENEKIVKKAEEERRRARKERKLMEKELARQQRRSAVGTTETGEEKLSRHGRAKPTYKHLYKQALFRRQRRKRDPETGELMPLSDEESAQQQGRTDSSSEDDDDGSVRPSGQHVRLELKRRRRRKRDPVTGELLPLPDEPKQTSKVMPRQSQAMSESDRRPTKATKPSQELAATYIDENGRVVKRRRKRHPQTGELMPFGWKPGMPVDKPKQLVRSTGRVVASGLARSSQLDHNPPSPDFKRMSLADTHESKRRKVSRPSSPAVVVPSPAKAKAIESIERGTPFSTVSTSASGDESAAVGQSVSKAPTMNSMLKRFQKPAVESSVEPPASTKTVGMTKQSTTTSDSEAPMNTMTATHQASQRRQVQRSTTGTSTSSIQPLQINSPNVASHILVGASQIQDESDNEDEDVAEDEFEIDAILAHHMSDPRTHQPELGRKPVMLYQVKWVGWDQPTWEPEESFGDLSLVREYQRRAGMVVGGGDGEEGCDVEMDRQ